MQKTFFIDHIQTPIGAMEIVANDNAVLSIHFVARTSNVKSNALTILAKTQLRQYFESKLEQFDLPLQPAGTEFQQTVWRALTSIPFGQTAAYADIAKLIHKPKAVRAVGNANGKNPMTIVIPCHRIIGSDGTLTGYASGVERKAWLLKHESVTLF
ncbi:methylated-DNA--[protein]-cysteine S-methyltransferase [Arenicella sp.]|nr:methylated-DNA--[protein]-cysteine S-methyltransferase [Arenicella sp.]